MLKLIFATLFLGASVSWAQDTTLEAPVSEPAAATVETTVEAAAEEAGETPAVSEQVPTSEAAEEVVPQEVTDAAPAVEEAPVLPQPKVLTYSLSGLDAATGNPEKYAPGFIELYEGGVAQIFFFDQENPPICEGKYEVQDGKVVIKFSLCGAPEAQSGILTSKAWSHTVLPTEITLTVEQANKAAFNADGSFADLNGNPPTDGAEAFTVVLLTIEAGENKSVQARTVQLYKTHILGTLAIIQALVEKAQPAVPAEEAAAPVVETPSETPVEGPR